MVGDVDVIDVVEKLRKLCHVEILSVGLVNEVKKKVLKKQHEEEKIEDKKYRDPASSLSNRIGRVMWNNSSLGFRVLDIFRLFKIKNYENELKMKIMPNESMIAGLT